MIDQRRLADDVDRSRISSDAEITGASYLSGPETSVAAGAVVKDARLHNATVLGGASVIDSIVVAEGPAESHKCDAAGRTVSGGVDRPTIGAGSEVRGCTLTNVAVGDRSRVSNTWAYNCQIGEENLVTDAKLVLVTTSRSVKVTGPTEISEAWLGHGATINKRGYFEGVFSNRLLKLAFNESAGRLEVTGAIDLPHVSRYGLNTINSTNSGKLLPQPGGVLEGFGPPKGLWHDELLNHEQVELGPCCWVSPWTKVIGQSPSPHHSDEELVNDPLTTYIMSFAVAGFGGDLTRGLVAPGELSTGLGPKDKIGAWTFTYCPEAVISMVARLYEAMDEGGRGQADTVVVEALRTALEMAKADAAGRGVDLSQPTDRQRPGWPRRIATTYALLNAHLDGQLWRFEGGRPVEWHLRNGRWVHPRFDRVLAVCPDAVDKQVSEGQIMTGQDPVPSAGVQMPEGAVCGSGGDAEIDPGADVAPDARIGPGCRIGPECVIESGATVWNSVLDRCRVQSGASVSRSALRDSTVGRQVSVRSCRLAGSSIGDRSTLDCASVVDSSLAGDATVGAFADLANVKTSCGAILGGRMSSAEISTHMMSMHMAGGCKHLDAVPTTVVVDGQAIEVPAAAMLGGGSLIRGEPERPVKMECCFIGSNAIVEPDTYVGFGCFVLGVLGPDAGLLPFTVSTGGGPGRHQIGAALGSLASTVITHFVNWTYQAVGPDRAGIVAQLVPQAIQRGIDAVAWETQRRAGKAEPADSNRYACYRSLRHYADAQLASGLANYNRALQSGAWEMLWKEGELRFAGRKGRWMERQGGAFWKKS